VIEIDWWVGQKGTRTLLSGVGHAVHPARVQAPVTVHGTLVPVLVAVERAEGGQRRHLVRVGRGVTADGQRADRHAAGLVRVTRRVRVVQVLKASGAALAGRYEHDYGDQHGAAYGRAGRDRYPVHVARCRHRGPDLATLSVRHRLRRHIYLL